jgi:hypothetical protein
MPAVQETIERVRHIDVDQYKYGFVTDIESDKAPKGLTVDQPPWLELFYEESDSNERLRVSNWIVQRLYHYAIKETVEF